MRNGSAHGVFLFNSNGMDIKINQTEEDGQYLEYNTIGGVLDFYFLAGPSPADVSRQYAGVVGTVRLSKIMHVVIDMNRQADFYSPPNNRTGPMGCINANTATKTS